MEDVLILSTQRNFSFFTIFRLSLLQIVIFSKIQMSSNSKVAVILGFGLAVGSSYLQCLLKAGYQVAIVARNLDTLKSTVKQYGDQHVVAYQGDLSKPETVQDLLNNIAKDLKSLDAVVYNGVVTSVPYDAPLSTIMDATNINITSLHVAFNTALIHFKKAGHGRFYISGGGAGIDGSWSVPFGMQFGAAAKAYDKNFAQSANATFGKEGIYTCCFVICNLVFGGKNITSDMNNDPEAAEKFKKKLEDSFDTEFQRTSDFPADVVIAL
jgi:NADP-dependent 3-hydroxy acid dehydrogenase YdfG